MSLEESKPSRRRLPEGVPALYADHIVDAIYGFHTTKLVLGVEDGIDPNGMALAENMRSVAVVTMPTPLLLAAALKLVQDLTSDSFLQETAGRYGTILEQMQAVNFVRKANADSLMPAESAEPKQDRLAGGQTDGRKKDAA